MISDLVLGLENSLARLGKSYSPYLILLVLLLFVGCTPTAPEGTPSIIRVQYTFATQPWLSVLESCANGNVLSPELRAADYLDVQSADLVMRLGQFEGPASPIFQVGMDDLLVIVNNQNPTHSLTADQVRGLFSGSIQNWLSINNKDAPVQVWVFSANEDLEEIFSHTSLGDMPVSSQAFLATSPEQMTRAIAKDQNAIGIITRRLIGPANSPVFTASMNIPVLVSTREEPRGSLAQMISCIQNSPHSK